MRALAFAVLLALACVAFGDVYSVKHRRPTYILGALTGQRDGGRVYKVGGGIGLIRPDVKLTADDKARTITIEGPASAIDEMKRVIAEFDVAPLVLKARIVTTAAEDRYKSETTTEISNNAGWRYIDERAGVDLNIRPRINGDGTVTVVMELNIPRKTSMVARIKASETMVIGFDADAFYSQGLVSKQWSKVEKGGKATQTKDLPSVMVSVQFELPAGGVDPIDPRSRQHSR